MMRTNRSNIIGRKSQETKWNSTFSLKRPTNCYSWHPSISKRHVRKLHRWGRIQKQTMTEWKPTDLGHSGMLRAKLYSMRLTAAFSVHPKSLKWSIMKVHINLDSFLVGLVILNYLMSSTIWQLIWILVTVLMLSTYVDSKRLSI